MPALTEIAQAVASYIPITLTRQLWKSGLPEPGRATWLEAAVLFADVSGFTPMSETLAELGTEGAEALQRVLNATFAAMIDHIHAYGGAVAHFGGDATTAFFPDDDGGAARRALTCGLAMQATMRTRFNPIQTAGGPFRLQMRIGVGYGRVAWLLVGDPEQWAEFVLVGEGLERAVAAERQAPTGQVISCPAALAQAELPPSSEGKILKRPEGLPRPLPVVDWDQMNPADAGRLAQKLAPYLPEAVYNDLVQGHGAIVSAHRPVTNVFVQFEGLDSTSADIGATLRAYCNWAHELAQRFGGCLNRVLTGDKGNQLHLLFGAPTAHSDDPARALRFALVLQRQVPYYITAQRIGIASGPVFAGPVGSDKRREYTVMGNVVNLAAHLMGICPPGAILADERTADASRENFSFSGPDMKQLKGKARPTPVYRPQAEITRRSNLENRYVRSQRPLIGRDAEQELVLGVAEAALRGAAGLILLCGPIGVGKSRMLQWLVERWLEQEGNGFGSDCQPHTHDAPFAPWTAIWRAFFELAPADSTDKQAARVKNRIRDLSPDQSEMTGLMGQLLNLPMALSPAEMGTLAQTLSELDAETRRERLFALCLVLLKAQAARQPLLLILEDVQFADQATLDLLTYLAERIAGHPILICVTCQRQDDLPPALSSAPISVSVPMFDLPSRFGRPLVESILGPVELPDPVRAVLGLPSLADERGDAGLPINPFFLDAAVRTLVEAGVFQMRAGRYRVDAGRLAHVQIPNTLHGLILARLDRLPAVERELLQVASALGREFTRRELQAAYGDEEQRDRQLAELVKIEHLSRRDDHSFFFRSAAVHNVVYESIPFARRRELHGRIGLWLEATHKEQLEAALSVLASHFVRSQEHQRAVRYALAAGHQARKVFAANKEAAAFYDQVERHLARLEETSATALELSLSRGQVRLALGDYDGMERDANFALTLARQAGDTRAEAQAWILLAELRWWQERNNEALAAAQAAHQVAEAGEHEREIVASLRLMGFAHSAAGNLTEALACFHQGRDLATALNDQFNLAFCLTGIGITHTKQKTFKQALEAFEEALALQQAAGRTNRAVALLNNVAAAQLRLGQVDAALTEAVKGEQLARSSGNDMRLAYTLTVTGEAHCYLGDYTVGGAALEEAVELFEQMEDTVGRAYTWAGLGRFHAIDVGDPSLARRYLEDALAFMRELENEEGVIEMLLSLGQLELQLGDLESAETNLQQAAALCEGHEKTWELPELSVRQGELATAQGDWEAVRCCAGQALDQIDTGGCPDWRVPARRLLALAAAHLGDADPIPLFRQSVAEARQRTRRIELARCLQTAGEHLVKTAEYLDEGTHCLKEAAELFKAMGL